MLSVSPMATFGILALHVLLIQSLRIEVARAHKVMQSQAADLCKCDCAGYEFAKCEDDYATPPA